MIYTFSGPTVSPSEIRRQWPHIVALPPVKHLDLFHIDLNHGDVVVIVDGVFRDSPPLRHKELLAAMDSGVIIIGTAGTGALRATELRQSGMLGMGLVSRLYARGYLDGDDEVVAAHGPAEEGFARRGETLVNIRVSLRHARAAGFCTQSEEARVISAAKSMCVDARTVDEIERVSGVSLARLLAAHGTDVQRHDALNAIANAAAPSASRESHARMFRTKYFERWRLDRDRHLTGDPRTAAPAGVADATDYAQILCRDFPERSYRHRLCVFLCREELVAEGGDAQDLIQAAGRLIERDQTTGKGDPGLLPDRLDIGRYILALEKGGLLDAGLEALEAKVAAEARRLGWCGEGRLPASLLNWLFPGEHKLTSPDAQIATMIARAIAPAIQFQRFVPVWLCQSGALEGALAGAVAVQQFNLAIATRRPDQAAPRIKEDLIWEWLASRWGRDPRSPLTLADRGFTDTRQLLWRARPFYLADRFTDAHRDISIERLSSRSL